MHVSAFWSLYISLKNVLRIVPNHFRLLSDVHTNIQDCFTNGTEYFQLVRNIFSNDLEMIQNVLQ